MIAAIYARKSTAQNGVEKEDTSVARQVTLARDFIASKKDWTVADQNIYIDDAISGGDFKNREGLARLLAALTQKPRPFDVVVTMDESRLGRDQFRTGYLLQTIADAGVRVFFYQSAREAKLDDATGSDARRSSGSCSAGHRRDRAGLRLPQRGRGRLEATRDRPRAGGGHRPHLRGDGQGPGPEEAREAAQRRGRPLAHRQRLGR
jgi:hypothetical protein